MSSSNTLLPPASGAESDDLWIGPPERPAGRRRRDGWRDCMRATRAVAGALRRAQEADADGEPALARVYVDQARRRAGVAARLLDRYDSLLVGVEARA
jgi:hypothetical protein